MRTIELKIYKYSELSKEAKRVVKYEMASFVDSILDFSYQEINASFEAFKTAYLNGNRNLNKDDLPLTGVCYDYDFIELLETDNDCVMACAQMVKVKLKRNERIYAYKDDALSDLFDANEIEFLETGKEYKKD